ncbi:helix-turn-helix domain-containing protein [Maricaulis sp.]|uniref:helix-turn-helix domain-containing protein n=1 Tax=Maricaulis sp. TaxID=1486257 RepID=UPI0026024D51|nr:helix-turn-helix domain-containing protein [Maricaulis sp.]
MDWAQQIRELRFHERLKQHTLAEQLGVSQALISQWERGVATPPARYREILRRRFTTSPSDQLLRSIHASVSASPNITGLLSVRSDQIVLEAQSEAGFALMPLLTRDDVGEPMNGKFGEQVDENYRRIVRSEILSGDVASVRTWARGNRHGREFCAVSAYTPFRLDNGDWFLRAEMRILEPENAVYWFDHHDQFEVIRFNL